MGQVNRSAAVKAIGWLRAQFYWVCVGRDNDGLLGDSEFSHGYRLQGRAVKVAAGVRGRQ